MAAFGAWHFGQIDLVEIALAAVLFTQRGRIEKAIRALARHPRWCFAGLCLLVVALRLALLPLHPVPSGYGADDFSYLLLGDTFAHGRLTNATHPLHGFFETNFVLQQPSYSSIYAPGQGIVLAFGQVVFRLPWAGVLISMALLSGLIYWMLRGWLPPGWALAGGLLAVCEFGPLNSWMNCYWGGAVSGIAGCLVFGALPRLEKRVSVWNGVLLGAGIGLQMIARPYESLFLDAAVVLFVVPQFPWRRMARIAAFAAIGVLPILALMLAHDRAVTGSAATLPYALSRYQYGVPTSFTFQPVPQPHHPLTPAQELYYVGQSAAHGPGETPGRYLSRLFSRLHFYLFFWEVPLLLALPFFVPLLRRFRYAWMTVTLLLFALGCNFYPYFFPQYLAAATCLFLLVALIGLRRMAEWSRAAAAFLLLLCGAHFLFWYAVHALGSERTIISLAPQESDLGINFGDPEGRIAIERQLARAPGKQLVLVRYFPTHGYHEWVHNGAEIDSQRVVWALELSPAENAKIEAYYPDRKVWLAEPDADPPKLVPYPKTTGPFLTVE